MNSEQQQRITQENVLHTLHGQFNIMFEAFILTGLYPTFVDTLIVSLLTLEHFGLFNLSEFLDRFEDPKARNFIEVTFKGFAKMIDWDTFQPLKEAANNADFLTQVAIASAKKDL